jgi:hypothetical protein
MVDQGYRSMGGLSDKMKKCKRKLTSVKDGGTTVDSKP